MMMWSSRRMSNSSAARATRSVNALSCPLASGGARRMVVDQDQLRSEQLQRPFDDQPVIDHRARHPALAHALTLDDAVRRSEVNHPALLVGEALQLRPEQPHHVIARRHGIGLRSPVRCRAASELRGRQQHPRPFQTQSADHAQAGWTPRRYAPANRRKPPATPAACPSS